MNQGSRRGSIPRVRAEIAERLVKEIGIPLAGAARLSGVERSAISKILHRIGHDRRVQLFLHRQLLWSKPN